MREEHKEEALSLFLIILSLVAVSVLMYMIRDPNITGNVALAKGSITTVGVVSVLILVALAVLIGTIVAIYHLKKQVHSHKSAIGDQKTDLHEIDLEKYVEKAKKKGFSDAQIKERLQKSKWTDKQIKKFI